MNKTVGFFAGLIGGIFAFIATLFVFLFEFDHVSEMTPIIWLGFLFSVLAITGAIVARSKGTNGGIMLMIAAIGVFFTVSMFNFVSSILILIAGFAAMTTPDADEETNPH